MQGPPDSETLWVCSFPKSLTVLHFSLGVSLGEKLH